MSGNATPNLPATNIPIPQSAIEIQLERLLNSPLFNHSRRYPSFLRYVVDEALKGQQEQLKERSIGISVFARSPDYDLNTDPVVRVTAGEVRKRLAQYYYEAKHQDELRIELHPGSYIPEFKFPTTRENIPNQLASSITVEQSQPRITLATVTDLAVDETNDAQQSVLDIKLPIKSGIALDVTTAQYLPGKLKRPRHAVMLTLAAALLVAILGGLYALRTRSAINQFWDPALKSGGPLLISVGSWEPSSASANKVSINTHAKTSDPVALADTVAIAGIQRLLAARSRSSVIQSSSQTTFSDVQRGTTILVSAFDNPWTMRLVDPLRFHFVSRNTTLLAIEDRDDPSRTDWQIDTNTPYSTLTRDFAIIARFNDPTTGQVIVVAAGIGENGTVAAGQMLTSEDLLKEAMKDAGLKAGHRNVEAVVETMVINGNSGPPRVVALTSW